MFCSDWEHWVPAPESALKPRVPGITPNLHTCFVSFFLSSHSYCNENYYCIEFCDRFLRASPRIEKSINTNPEPQHHPRYLVAIYGNNNYHNYNNLPSNIKEIQLVWKTMFYNVVMKCIMKFRWNFYIKCLKNFSIFFFTIA